MMNKKMIAKKIAQQFAIPTKTKIENAKSVFNFQFGKIIFQIKKE